MAPVIAPFVDVAWLKAATQPVVLADVRFYLDGRSAREAYEAGHLPGAVFIDLERWLAAPASPAAGRHPLPTPEAFAEGMAAAGIGDDTVVVAYDDAGGVMAARLVWMLRAIGHQAAVLDGGIGTWDGPLDRGDVTAPPRAHFTPAPWPVDRLATIDDAQDPAHAVLDARPAERFAGGEDPIDPRAGHIPGARSVPCRDNVGPDGRLMPAETLRATLGAAGADGTRPVISYCGSGVTACHTLLVLEHVGVPDGRLYPGSWSQYSHTTLPLETGLGG